MCACPSSASAPAATSPRAEYALRTQTAHLEPIARRQSYTEPYLTLPQYGSLIGLSSLGCACLSRPLAKLEYFYFLSDVPGESNRIFLSDKRAQFFRVLFNTSWWSGRTSLALLTADYATSLGAFVVFRGLYTSLVPAPDGQRINPVTAHVAPSHADVEKNIETQQLVPPDNVSMRALGEPRRVLCGVLAGASAGVVSCGVRHPCDVLRATADMQSGPRRFRGPRDVFWTALRERPVVLMEIYRGFGTAASGRALRYGAQFGLYDWLRYDGTYRGTVFLFLYCQLATVCGMALEYPILSMKQQLKHINAMARGAKPLTYRSLFYELRRRHGISKVWDGFFTTKPFLNAIAPALLMTVYDVGSRRWTERLHPSRHRAVAAPSQSLTSISLPDYATTDPGASNGAYEFEHRTKRTERLHGQR